MIMMIISKFDSILQQRTDVVSNCQRCPKLPVCGGFSDNTNGVSSLLILIGGRNTRSDAFSYYFTSTAVQNYNNNKIIEQNEEVDLKMKPLPAIF